MSAWNTEPGGETFADVVKHSDDNVDHHEQAKPEPASAASIEVTKDEFPELAPADETASTTETAAPATKDAPVESAEETVEEPKFDPSDVLASSLSSAFSPPPPPASAEEPESNQGTITPLPPSALPGSLGSAAAPADPTEASPPNDLGGSPDPTLVSSDNWKAELDERTRVWKAENHVAREKAEKSRAKWEAVREGEKEVAQQEALKKKQENKDQVKEEKKINETRQPGGVEKELGLEAAAVGLEVEGARIGEDEARWAKVEQAWEGVGHGKETDSYGTAKVENGQIVETVDPTISSDPEPPVPQHKRDTNLIEGSRQPTSSSEEKQVETTDDSSSDPTAQPDAPADLPISHYLTHPGGAPPSLTLALFTSKYLPPRRRILLGLACFSINVILPFIGGMMAGWGEITAKLLMDVARDTWFGTRGAGRGVGGVGLGQVREGSIPKTEVGREAVRTALVDNPMEKAFP